MMIINPYRYTSAAGLLLDTYSNGLVAFSLRQLKTSATNCIRVREDGGDTETDIGFSSGVVDTAAIASHCGANNGYVVTWYDQSGNANDVTQATASQQAQIYNGSTTLTKNGKAGALNVEPSNQYYQRAAISALAAGNAFSSFSVTSEENPASLSGIWSTSTGAGDRVTVLHDTRNSPTRHLFIQASSTNYFADLSTARNDTNQHLLSSFVTTGKAMSAFDNGATGGTATYVGTYNNDTFDFLRQANGSIELDGYFQELIIFSSDQSANRTSIETDINNYYSIF